MVSSERLEDVVAANPALATWLRGKARGTLWIAFSGGLDSTVLAHLLRAVGEARAIHVDHGIAARSADWARHCEAAAVAFGLRFTQRRAQVPRHGNLEAAARRARYDCWRALLAEGDVLALAHHGDDQAETRAWQWLTGRFPGGMPAERPLGAGRLLRPLLGVPRRAIADYAGAHGLVWREDESNADLRFDRNFIRHRLLQPMAERFPEAMRRLRAPRPAPAATGPLATAAVAEDAVAAWLLQAGLPLARRAVAEIVRQTNAAPDRHPRVAIAPGVEARRFNGAWHLVAPAAGRPAAHPVAAGVDRQLSSGTLTWRETALGLPPGKALTLRCREGGERLRPAGRGVAKSVKALLREERVAPWLRTDWPLLIADGRLQAVPSFAVDERAVVPGGLFPEWRPACRHP